MSYTRQALAEYANKAADLAEAVKRNLSKDSKIDDKTILALNAFVIAANNVKDLTDQLNEGKVTLN